MRLSFSDGVRLKAAAKRELDSGMASIKRWWSEKYHLPPTHPLFLGYSLSEHMQDMYEDLMLKRREARHSLEAGSENSEMLFKQINNINKVLGDPTEVSDPLFDKWERELEAGIIPDLDELPEGF